VNPALLQASLRDLLYIVLKRKWSALTVFLTAFLSGAFYILIIRDDVYMTKTKLLVKIGKEQAPPATMMGDAPMMTFANRYQDVKSEVDILQSDDLLDKVIRKLHLDQPRPADPPPEGFVKRLRYEVKRINRKIKDLSDEILISVGLRERLTPYEKAMTMLQKGLKVEAPQDSNVIVATLFLPFPTRQGISMVLNELVDEYQDYRQRVFQDPTAVEFLNAQRDESLAKLRKAEQELQNFQGKYNIVDQEKQEASLLQQISDMRSRLALAEIGLQEATAKVARLDALMKSPEPDFASLGGFTDQAFPEYLLQQLTQLRINLLQARSRDREDDVRIVNIKEQFNSLLKLVASNLTTMKAERTAAVASLKGKLTQFEKELDQLHQRQAELSSMQRSIRSLDLTYSMFQKKLDEARAAAELEKRHVGNVVVIQKAEDPITPTGMTKSTMAMILTAVSLFASLTWVSVAEFFDHAVYQTSQLEDALNAPVFATIARDRRVPQSCNHSSSRPLPAADAPNAGEV
jgi:uncharacterized protein involved in exopolysaccharide biosynthesis